MVSGISGLRPLPFQNLDEVSPCGSFRTPPEPGYDVLREYFTLYEDENVLFRPKCYRIRFPRDANGKYRI
jgi:hypothetical protein